ncbi:hypothetical protein K1719_031204 [Acacia pycnantha]|nr:hypothetical protein K1719_031204 [Acacia pycnantha]
MDGSVDNSTFPYEGFISGNESTTNNDIPRQQSQPQGGPTLRSVEVSIDIPAGKDVVHWLFQFCLNNKVSLTVLHGCGVLSEVIPLWQENPIIGPFLIQSLFSTVTVNPMESFLHFPMILEGPYGILKTYMVGGMAWTTVRVVAIMTVFEDVEDRTSSSNLSPHIINNVQSGESSMSDSTQHLNILTQSETEIDAVDNLMNSVYNEMFAVPRG